MSEGKLTPEQLDRQYFIEKEAARRAKEEEIARIDRQHFAEKETVRRAQEAEAEEALERKRRDFDKKNPVQFPKDLEENYFRINKPPMDSLPPKLPLGKDPMPELKKEVPHLDVKQKMGTSSPLEIAKGQTPKRP